MRHSFNTLLLTAALMLATCAPLCAAPATLTVDVAKPGHAISPTLYGIFFEDINCSADGGIYAEMVRNRNLEDSGKPDHWTVVSNGAGSSQVAIDSVRPVSPRNAHALRVTFANAGGGRRAVANNGY